MTAEHQMGKMTIAVKMLDYKPVDGIMFPHRILQEAMGVSVEITVDSIEHNIEFPADRFDPPAEVQALLEQSSAKE